jgi:hypothetical protein
MLPNSFTLIPRIAKSSNDFLYLYFLRPPKNFSTAVLGSVLGSSTLASYFFGAFGGFWGWGVVWGGDIEEETRGGEWGWRVGAVGGFWREGGVVWGGYFGEWTCGGERYWRAYLVDEFWGEGVVVWGGDWHSREWCSRGYVDCGEQCWRACSVDEFWEGVVVWGGDWHSREWCSRGYVDCGFWRGGVVWGGDFGTATRGGE